MSIMELVECARTGLQPGAELQEHLSECSQCSERWEDERRLTAQFRTMRHTAAARRQSEVRREQIMREFALAHQHATHSSFRWALGIAAMLLLAIALGQAWRNGRRLTDGAEAKSIGMAQNSRTSSPGNSEAPAQTPIAPHRELSEGIYLESPPEDPDFVAVPYAPPLATGEFVRVVRTNLRPIALAGMGIYVDAGAGEIPAEVAFGEDGFPRAVRVFGDIEF